MNSSWINRAIMVASWVGIYIAGVLTYAHVYDLSVPCGTEGSSGCDAVQTSVLSEIAGIPVSLLGMGAYIVLAALALLREWANEANWRRLGFVGMGISGVGTAFSLFLTWFALGPLQTSCPWCVASLVTMTAIFVLHAWMLQVGFDEIRLPKYAIGVTVIAFFVSGFAASYTIEKLQDRLDQMGASVNFNVLSMSEVLPQNDRMIGPEDAPVTIVEFSDMNCPTCRNVHPEFKALMARYEGKVRYGFRHLPLFQIPGHETSPAAAVLAEYAATKGKFWDFINTAMAPESAELMASDRGLMTIVQQVGLDTAEANEALRNGKNGTGVPFERMSEDLLEAQELGIAGTPTFLVYVEGKEPRAESYPGLVRYLGSPDIQRLLN